MEETSGGEKNLFSWTTFLQTPEAVWMPVFSWYKKVTIAIPPNLETIRLLTGRFVPSTGSRIQAFDPLPAFCSAQGQLSSQL